MKIALVGYARSGKDTVASIIQELCPPIVTLSFADEMKNMFHDTFPNVPRIPKPRDGYEKFGMSMREIDENVWINKLAKSFSMWECSGAGIIITDVRMPNEAQWCRENGFAIVCVSTKDEVRRDRAAEGETFHKVNTSEQELWQIDWDYIIGNSGTREELEINVARFINCLVNGTPQERRPIVDDFPL
ncbi:hypothetical protein [Paenibacillus sp. OV219]|uniref:hypothetical protein n=1 Tax=Paenibacillus sp. OV219 TaxID=1884377 RepID=UPI0008CE1BA6|nr:hypothetical protein [Paenibacillus sp. OV219]SEN21108.1 hypothetical protein SAMN05518847_102422 [Paenibacillus sp. OV219]